MEDYIYTFVLLTHSLTHSLTDSLTHSLTHRLTHSLGWWELALKFHVVKKPILAWACAKSNIQYAFSVQNLKRTNLWNPFVKIMYLADSPCLTVMFCITFLMSGRPHVSPAKKNFCLEQEIQKVWKFPIEMVGILKPGIWNKIFCD